MSGSCSLITYEHTREMMHIQYSEGRKRRLLEEHVCLVKYKFLCFHNLQAVWIPTCISDLTHEAAGPGVSFSVGTE